MYRTLLAIATAAVATLSMISIAQADPVIGGATNHASPAQTDSYWTPERLANAKPAPAPARSGGATRAQTEDGPPVSIPATKPAGDFSAQASVWNTLGRLVFTNPGVGDYICTANVVTSNNRDVLATARHCVMDIATGKVFQNFRFAPGYSNGNTPHGWWNWRAAGWRIDDKGPGGDNAFIVLNTGGNNGGHVQDAVGSSGLGFNWGLATQAYGFGIPGATNTAVWCGGKPYNGQAGGVQIPNCNGLSGGASGGAFIVNFQSDQSGTQTASYFGSWGDSYFAYYRNAALEVYNGATNR